MMKINKIKNRILFLSPTVQAGWEEQSYKTDFQMLQTLGQGTFGTVWKAKHKKLGKVYAIKQIKKKSISNERALEHVRNQVKIMYSLNHYNITKLYNHFQDEISLYLVLEYVSGGQLFKALYQQPNGKFTDEKASKYTYQVACAIKYIHDRNIIHRDIKPQNILLNEFDSIKLADFGWSNFFSGKQKRETYCGTLDYLAPEMLTSDHKHDASIDIWCLGVLAYELCTGTSPFSNQLMKQNNLTEEKVKLNIVNLRYKMPQLISDKANNFIQSLLKKNPQQRPNIKQVLQHPWLKKFKAKEKPHEQTVSVWKNTLKEQFKTIVNQEVTQFSQDQIYNYSRPESIINLKGQKKISNDEWKNKKLIQMELKFKEYEEQRLKDKKQIARLTDAISAKADHSQCLSKIDSLTDQLVRQNRVMQVLNEKLKQAEEKVRQYQLKK